jgi:hypothetical protein
MIISRITDGIGNQLFQYATGRAIALRTGLPMRLHPFGYSPVSNRSFRLETYGLPATVMHDNEVARYLGPLRSHRRRWVRKLSASVTKRLPFGWRRVVQERSLRFDPRILRIARPAYLAGFWQSERYFEDHSAAIRMELTLRHPIPERSRAVVEEIDGSESVGVVVRRGDYVGIPETQGICTSSYYERALSTLAALVPNGRVFVFSDDIPWCRENLDVVPPDSIFVANEIPAAPEEHLRLLSRCRHFILANSTFAWWGAWLSLNPNKVVIGPSKWMQAGDRFVDILPSRWLRVPAG